MGQGDVDIELRGDDADLRRALNRGEGAVRKFGRSVKNVFGAIAAAAVFQRVFSAIGNFLDLAQEQIDAEAKLGAVLTATGHAAGFAKGELVKYAADLQALTGIGDEVIMNAEAVILTFKNIKGDNFKLATAAALDMSVALDSDLKSAALQVGKALNDPVKGLRALSRAGVSFTKEQEETIKALVEGGRAADAQRIILAELQSEFGGVAQAMGEARSPFAKLQETVTNIAEDLGHGLMPAIEAVTPAITGLGTALKKIVPYFADLIVLALDLASSFYESVAPAFTYLADIAVSAFTAIEVVIINWRETMTTVVSSVYLTFVTFWEDVKYQFTDVLPGVFSWFVDNFGNIMTDAANFLRTVLSNMSKNIWDFGGSLINFLQGKGWNFEFTALTEGFETSLKKLPEIADRQMTDLEKQLSLDIDAATDAMAKTFADRFAMNRQGIGDLFKPEVDENGEEVIPDLDLDNVELPVDLQDLPPIEWPDDDEVGDGDAEARKRALEADMVDEPKDDEGFTSRIEGLRALGDRIQAAAAGVKPPEEKVEDAVNIVGANVLLVEAAMKQGNNIQERLNEKSEKQLNALEGIRGGIDVLNRNIDRVGVLA